LYLGNLEAKRDWGYAPDYAQAMWLMLQQDKPEDYVIATGETHSVREFVEYAFDQVGIEIEWQGKGVEEKGLRKGTGDVIIEIDPGYFRPTEVDILLGDPTKAKKELKWEPKVKFEELVRIMAKHDLRRAKYEKYKNNFKG
jgi:GDPmannose 4,6-dehydratase